MNILKISHSYYPENNAGVEIYVDALSNVLSRENKLMLFTQSEFVKEPVMKYVGAYQIYAVPHESSARTKLAALKKCIKTFQPDLVHIHHLHNMGLSLPVYLMQRNIPYVVTLHDYFFICRRIRLIKSGGNLCDYPYDGCASCMYPKKFIKRFFLKFGHARRNRKTLSILDNAAFIIAPSNLIKKKFLEFGVMNENFAVTQPGIDVNLIRRKRRLDGNHTEIKVGFVGTIGIFKGIEVLLKAFKALDVPNELLLYGKVYAKDDKDAVALQEMINSDSKIILKGEFDHHTIGEVLSKIDILVVPSLCEETHCLIIDEARCAGVPVIASRVGSIPDRIVDGINGFLVEAGNVEMLTEKIKMLITDYEYVVNRMDFKYKLVTIENNAEYHESVYRQILNKVKGHTL
jgi:glycosyltransferase involved in cell wall biosynthesis